MAYKETKRKAFNFLRSYFDVVNELEKDKDKLEFLMSIINKQFLDESPKDLNFIVNLCYSSQKHQIESSVKGWKRVFKTEVMTDPTTNPLTDPPTNPKEEEVEEEEKGEGKGKHLFKNSPYFIKRDYLDAIEIIDFKTLNIDFGAYWYSMDDYSEQNGKMYKNWLATAKSWIRRDIKDGKVKTKESKGKGHLEW